MDNDKKNPKEASKIFEGVIRASFKSADKPKIKTMNYEEAKKKSDTLQTMIGKEYNFPSGIATAIKVKEFEVKDGVYEVVAVGESDTGYYFAFVADNQLKPVEKPKK